MDSCEIDMLTEKKVSGSFRDPCGYVFSQDGVVYRSINQLYADDYNHLLQSGLYDRLVDAGLLIPHEEVTLESPQNYPGVRIIRPEKIEQIAYPYEFCFSQLRDAALVTLNVQQISLQYGMSLKDSSAYNIQFHKGRPIFIDTLSFEKIGTDTSWIAYGQFCRHFLAPLILMASVDLRLNRLLTVFLDGVPLDLASSLLPFSKQLRPSILLHIILHAKLQKLFGKRYSVTPRKISSISGLALVDHLLKVINHLRYKSHRSEWHDYYEQNSYSERAFMDKKRIVSGFIDSIQPRKVWDLGGNTGVFSRLASERGIYTVCFDGDPYTIENNYLQTISNQERYLLPLVLDLTNPSPAIGWNNNERLSLGNRSDVDLIMALALIHHLAISNNIPLEMVAEYFQRLGRFLIIEFVPKEDSQVQRLLSTRKDIFENFHREGFEKAFKRYYSTHRCIRIEESSRWLYLMERNS